MATATSTSSSSLPSPSHPHPHPHPHQQARPALDDDGRRDRNHAHHPIDIIPPSSAAAAASFPPSSPRQQPAIAASYFGETSRLYFGPHFLVNSPHLAAAAAASSSDPERGGLSAAALAAMHSRSPMASDLWGLRSGVQGVSLSRMTKSDIEEAVRLYSEPSADDPSGTLTLESLVYLKKNSLRFVPVVPGPPSPSSSSSSTAFSFDASAPCTVTLYFACREAWVSEEVDDHDGGGGDGGGGRRPRLAFLPRPTTRPETLPHHVKTYGPFPQGLHCKFSLHDDDLFEPALYRGDHLFAQGLDSAAAAAPAAAAGDGELPPLPPLAPPPPPPPPPAPQPLEQGTGPSEVAAGKMPDAASASHNVPDTVVGELVGYPSDHPQFDDDGGHIYYPLVIVIDASNTEHDESILPVLVTYAVLTTHGGTIEAKVLKQKAMPSLSSTTTTSYTLHEIYGFTDPTGTGADEPTPPSALVSPEDLQTMRECVVCMAALKNTAVLPCRHLCLCRDCAEVLRGLGRSAATAGRAGAAAPAASGAAAVPKCPICRQVFHSMIEFSLPTPAAARVPPV
ncbi:hypothetical protein DFJ73DRAFT_783559 [Zopfochytrium polystomum]|nr:hypothetical protein DFJ73DRAFT_783559 [Zopfochytrium polystomum]